jgi:hypothetical protein
MIRYVIELARDALPLSIFALCTWAALTYIDVVASSLGVH